jgi:hypothetical protein
MSRAVGYMREEIEALKTENNRLRAELAIAQGTNRALEEWIKGYRIFGRKGAWLSWLVNGAPDREQGKAAAKEIVRLQVALDEALASTPNDEARDEPYCSPSTPYDE